MVLIQKVTKKHEVIIVIFYPTDYMVIIISIVLAL